MALRGVYGERGTYEAGNSLAIEAGLFSYSGGAVAFDRGRVMAINGVSYTYSASPITLTYTPINNYEVTPETAVFNYSGGPVTFNYSGMVIAEISEYTMTYARNSAQINFAES